MRNFIKLLFVGAFTILCSACSTSDILKSKVAEPQVYVIKPLEAGVAPVAYNKQLAIGLPVATPGLDSARIAVLRDGNHLDYYYGARWGGTAAEVTQAFLVSLLQTQQGFKSVVAENTRVNADYLLEIELRDFQAEYLNGNAAPIVKITLIASVIDIKARQSSALLRASASVAAKDNRLGAVVTAFQSAMQQASVSLSEQVSANLGK